MNNPITRKQVSPIAIDAMLRSVLAKNFLKDLKATRR
jgi:hypothetical protein